MMASAVPTPFPIPFASGAAGNYIRHIPQASQIGVQAGAASLTDGFPPLCFTPIALDGVWPFGADFNGILNEITAAVQWMQAGGYPSFSASFSEAINGYPAGAILAKTSGTGFWVSLDDNNTSDPDTGSTSWLDMQKYADGINTALTAFALGADWSVDLTGNLLNNGATMLIAGYYASAPTQSGSQILFNSSEGQQGFGFTGPTNGLITIANPGTYDATATLSFSDPGVSNSAVPLYFNGSAGQIYGPKSAQTAFNAPLAGASGGVYSTATLDATIRTTAAGQTIGVVSTLAFGAATVYANAGCQILLRRRG
jgi:hypothetical protein